MGSITGLDDGSSKFAVQSFAPYGNPIKTANAEPHGFTGERRDATGLIYLRDRYYDPFTARFVAADRFFIENPAKSLASPLDAVNGYQYARNNPVAIRDPTGLAPGDIWSYGPITRNPFGIAIGAGERVLGDSSPTDVRYVHSSIELRNGVHFSSGKSPGVAVAGSHLENGGSILDRMVLSGDRTIDVFRPLDASQFDVDAAQAYADRKMKTIVQYNFEIKRRGLPAIHLGSIEFKNLYLINGVCSTETAGCAISGGLDLGLSPNASLVTPLDIANSPAFAPVGRYDPELGQSMPLDSSQDVWGPAP